MVSCVTNVAGIGPSTAALLTEHGIESAEALANSPLERLLSIPGFGPARAQSVLAAAAEFAGAPAVNDAKSKKEKKKRKDDKRKEKKVKKAEEKDAKGKKSKGKRRKRKKRRKSKS